MFLDRYLSGIGIDLSDHHIRLAKVGFFGRVVHLEEVVLKEGLVVDDKIEQVDQLKHILADRLNTLNLHGAGYHTTVLVPESRVFSSSFLTEDSVKDSGAMIRAKTQAQRDIPIPFSQARVDVSQGRKEQGGIRTTVYAVEERILKALEDVVAMPLLRPLAFEANTKALFRLFQCFGNKRLQDAGHTAVVVIVDVGHSWTTVSFYGLGGSNLFSRTIPHHHRMEVSRGSRLLSSDVVNSIIETIRETMVFFTCKQFTIQAFLLAGVEAADAQLVQKIRAVHQAEIHPQGIAEVVAIPGVKAQDVNRFGSAIGAALRAAKPWRYTYQHNFLRS